MNGPDFPVQIRKKKYRELFPQGNSSFFVLPLSFCTRWCYNLCGYWKGTAVYVFLFLLWLILNGKITWEIIGFGLVLTALAAVLSKALFDYNLTKEFRILRKTPIFVAYVFVLLWEIVKAALFVSGIILHPNRRVETALVHFDPKLSTSFGRFILANSITLTPGTITVSADEKNGFVVHCLDRSLLDVSEDSVFLRWIRRLEA